MNPVGAAAPAGQARHREWVGITRKTLGPAALLGDHDVEALQSETVPARSLGLVVSRLPEAWPRGDHRPRYLRIRTSGPPLGGATAANGFGEKMVPLQDPLNDNAVSKPTETEPESAPSVEVRESDPAQWLTRPAGLMGRGVTSVSATAPVTNE